MSDEQCPWSIRWGVTAESVSRCDKPAGHELVDDVATHEGPGLAEFPYQRITWYPGDRREFRS